MRSSPTRRQRQTSTLGLSPARSVVTRLVARLGSGESAVFRVVAACQAVTVLVTWRLWGERVLPPPLPVFDSLPDFSLGPFLLATLLLAGIWPRIGTPVHIVVLAYGVLLDQTRLQPEFVSLAILMVALSYRPLRVVGRAHLVTLWIWAGVHKLLSLGFAGGGAVFIANGLGFPVTLVAWMAPMMEITVGLLALFRATRRGAIVLAFVVHGLILATLVAQGWNSAVWAWNIAIPVSAWSLLTDEREERSLHVTADEDRSMARHRLLPVFVWIVFWIYPAAFYLNAMDAYLAHNLYTSNTKSAMICTSGSDGGDVYSCQSPFGSTWASLNVPIPPETRLYRIWFAGACSSDDVLRVSPIRTRVTNWDVEEFQCPVTG